MIKDIDQGVRQTVTQCGQWTLGKPFLMSVIEYNR